MRADRPELRNLSEIYSYLRRNETPIYVITPTPFSLLGLDQWVGSLEFVNYFDIFEGQHPRCFVPPTEQAPEFKSMEDVANYLVDHPEFRAQVKCRPRGERSRAADSAASSRSSCSMMHARSQARPAVSGQAPKEVLDAARRGARCSGGWPGHASRSPARTV